MYRALLNARFLFGGEPLILEEGQLVELKALTPGEIDFLVAAEYVEKARGEKPQPETPEGKQKKTEKR